MGRAYEVRKASIQKTGAARGKIYSLYAREIYDVAKKGGTDPNSNASLKRLMERAKKEQVPSDIIKRAIDKVNSGVDENYEKAVYDVFGPGGSTLIVECLTDNVNRTISNIKAALNKCKCKIGAQGSVAYNYDNLCVLGFKDLDEESVMDAIISAGLDVEDIETDNDMVIITGKPKDIHALKEAIKSIKDVEFEIDEVGYYAKDKVSISDEDKEIFDRLYNMLDEIEDVQHIYHNVEE